MLRMFLFLSVVSLFVDLQINPFRPDSSLFEVEIQSLRFSVKIFSSSALCWGKEKEGSKTIFNFSGAADRLFALYKRNLQDVNKYCTSALI